MAVTAILRQKSTLACRVADNVRGVLALSPRPRRALKSSVDGTIPVVSGPQACGRVESTTGMLSACGTNAGARTGTWRWVRPLSRSLCTTARTGPAGRNTPSATITPQATSAHAPLARHYDAVVVGLGAYGSSVLYHLAKAGLKVLGVERHSSVGHSFGSSHGDSRIIRLAYFEGLQYGPLLKRSLRLFLELQDELSAAQGPLDEPLFLRTGMLDVGSVFDAALKSAQVHGLQHDVLTGAELNRRFPAYRVPADWRALYQPDGGVLAPERIVKAYVDLAQRYGAEVLTGVQVEAWRPGDGRAPDPSPVTLTLRPTAAAAAAVQSSGPPAAAAAGSGGGAAGGESGLLSGGQLPHEVHVTAGAAVLTPGPWIGQLVPELQDLCVPERQVVGWFEVEAASRQHFAPDRFPVFVLEERPGGAAYYGFPEHGHRPGFKIGLYRHLRQEIRDPAALDAVQRTADAADEAALRAGVASYFPAAGSGQLLAASACFFTNTPDGHFLIDRHPRHPQVILCSACSGHGFKMSSGIGQLIARMVAAELPARPSAVGADRPAAATGGVGTSGSSCDPDDDAGWAELRPFRFDVASRPGHREALRRFGCV